MVEIQSLSRLGVGGLFSVVSQERSLCAIGNPCDPVLKLQKMWSLLAEKVSPVVEL